MCMETSRSGKVNVAVTAAVDDEAVRARARSLATELGLPYVSGSVLSFGRRGVERNTGPATCSPDASRQVNVQPDERPALLLTVGERGLELRDAHRPSMGPVFVDFSSGPVGFRRKSDLSRRQPIALAVGLRRGPAAVVDATAGLARDSFLLAAMGCSVIAVERSPILGALVRDGLARARAEGPREVQAIVERITLVVADARDVLADLRTTFVPDVVYLDPMYPPKKKAALPKKEMRICRRLVGDDPDAGELLAVARGVAQRRVAVKRPRYAPPLAPGPVMMFAGKQVRYDVYHPRG